MIRSTREIAVRMTALSRLVLLASSVFALLSPPVFAQEEEAAEPAKKEQIEQITITAEKRESTMQKAPVAVTAFSPKDLQSYGIENAVDLNSFTPNLYVSQDAKGSIGLFTTSRGVGTADTGQIQMDPVTSFYIDGVYNGITLGSLFEVVDLERVEVLRGPQGTLYGRNTTGGAINFITRKPSGEWGATAKLTAGNYGRENFRTYFDIPLLGGQGFATPEWLGKLSTSFSITTLNRDAYFPNSAGDATDEVDRIAQRAAARWELGGGVTIDYSADVHQIRESSSTMQTTSLFGNTNGRLENGQLFDSSGGTQGVDLRPYTSYTRREQLDVNSPGDDVVDLVGHGLTLARAWDDVPVLGNFTSKAIVGYRRIDFQNTDDRDGSPYQVFFNTETATKKQTTLDANLVGSTWGDRISYVLGYYFFTEDGHSTIGQQIRLDPQYDAVNLGAGARDWGLIQTIFPEIDNTSHSVYGNLGYKLPVLEERVKLEAGLRYTYEDRWFANRQVTTIPVGTVNPSITTLPVGNTTTFPYREDSTTFDDLSPMGRVSFQATPDLLTYVSVSRGFRAGGFNGRASTTSAFQPYDSETLLSYEAGFKLQTLENRIRLNATGFYSDYKDMQRNVLVIAGSGTTAIVQNAADAQIWGTEIELLALPFEGVRVDASYGLALGKFKNYIDYDNNPLVLAYRDFSDERSLSNAPEHDLHVGMQYSLPSFSWGTVTARVDYSWQDQTLLQNGDQPKAGQNGYALFDARLSFDEIELPGNHGTVDIGLWGRNLLDREYKDFGIDFQTNTQYASVGFPWIAQTFGERRTLGIDMVWRWGSGR